MIQPNNKVTRRSFVRNVADWCRSSVRRFAHVLGGPGKTAPSDKINIAGIGVGGRGAACINGVESENIVALADVDDQRAADTYKRFPKAKRYRDFRTMLDELDKQIDAVIVGRLTIRTPWRCMNAIGRGKHVYCEKPLAHSVYEVRQIMNAAARAQGHHSTRQSGALRERIRRFCEWIWDGAIGQVTEIHAACDAFRELYCQIDRLPQLAKTCRSPPRWIGISGWALRRFGPTIHCICRSTGVAGCPSAPAVSVTGFANR